MDNDDDAPPFTEEVWDESPRSLAEFVEKMDGKRPEEVYKEKNKENYPVHKRSDEPEDELDLTISCDDPPNEADKNGNNADLGEDDDGKPGEKKGESGRDKSIN